MQLRPEQLAAHLAQHCAPLYLVYGDEPLLVQECSDQIRAAARRTGCSERHLLEVDQNFPWHELTQSAAEMSLFAERKLIELRLPGGKPGAEGSKALQDYLERSGGEDVLLIISGKIDKRSQSSKWFKALDRAGVVIQVRPVRDRELPRWLQQRLAAAGLEIDKDALELLSERLEGNLLAAVQEVEKLKLLTQGTRVTLDTVTAVVADNARYNIFGLADAALQGDATASLRMLHSLRGEGAEPTLVLWSLSREIRSLYDLHCACERGENLQPALASRGIWKSRTPLLQAALSRHDSDSLTALLGQVVAVDGSIKGYAGGDPWERLETLALDLCRP